MLTPFELTNETGNRLIITSVPNILMSLRFLMLYLALGGLVIEEMALLASSRSPFSFDISIKLNHFNTIYFYCNSVFVLSTLFVFDVISWGESEQP